MNTTDIVMLTICASLLLYLGVALLKPEKF
jgi:K+-transporting ATPase KdpF subunit